jgi:protoporphyrin/coproporphyrin ferrochelatase
MDSDLGILLVAHGTPATLDDIPAFLNNIRRGRPTPPDVVQAVRSRYEAIGGSSPLLTTTRAQAKLLSERTGLPCYVATRMWHPTFDEVLQQLAEAKTPRELIVVSAAPHSAHVYASALQASAEKLSEQGVEVPRLHPGPCWGTNPSFVRAWADAIKRELDRIGLRKTARAVLVPSAHSLPMRTIKAGDPYAQLVAETADAVVKELGQDALPSMLAFQSQGMSAEPWLGPDLPTVFKRAAETGAQGAIIVPVGFPAEHVETLYDLDIEARDIAKDAGIWLERVPCLDTAEGLIDAMQSVVDEMRKQIGR